MEQKHLKYSKQVSDFEGIRMPDYYSDNSGLRYFDTHNIKKNPFIFQISKLIETLEKQLSEKGVEINAYIAKNNIQVILSALSLI